ncbi:Tar ligand binding domain-containing protein, partial [Morganella morganii]
LIFCVLQLLTSGLYFNTVERGASSFHQVLSLNERNVLLSNVWSNFSQARLNLNRALISGRSENEIDSLLNSAIKNLKDVEGDWEKFNSTPNLHGQIRTNLEDSYNTYHTTIIELIQLIRHRDLNTAILQDTQTSQDAYL